MDVAGDDRADRQEQDNPMNQQPGGHANTQESSASRKNDISRTQQGLASNEEDVEGPRGEGPQGDKPSEGSVRDGNCRQGSSQREADGEVAIGPAEDEHA